MEPEVEGTKNVKYTHRHVYFTEKKNSVCCLCKGRFLSLSKRTSKRPFSK